MKLEVNKLASDYLNNKKDLFQSFSFRDSLNNKGRDSLSNKGLVFIHLKCDLFVGI